MRQLKKFNIFSPFLNFFFKKWREKEEMGQQPGGKWKNQTQMSETWLGVPSRAPATSQSHISILPTAVETWFVLSLVRDHYCGLRQILRSHWKPLLQWKTACWKKTWSLWVFPVPGLDSELWDDEFLVAHRRIFSPSCLLSGLPWLSSILFYDGSI